MNNAVKVMVCVAVVAAVSVKSHAAEAAYAYTTFAGSPGVVINSIDATGSAAQFSAPRGVAVDSQGNLYVADSGNHTIRKVTSAGVVTTLAGTAGTAGKTDGTGTAATFSEPFAVAVDTAGNVFVADTNSNAIRKITPAGVVTTLAGGAGKGSTDGTGAAAKFSEPRGIAVDSAGNLYVADYESHAVRKVTPAGVVTTLAGAAGITGFVNGQGAAARFQAPQGIALDSAGNIYVTESFNRSVRKITPAGLVTTLASGNSFGEPRGIGVDASGNVFVGDYTANVIRKVTAAGVVSTYAGTSPVAGSVDGNLASALFNSPSGVAVDSANNLYVGDTSSNTIRKISAGGVVTTLAGLAGRTASVDGIGAAARFEDPYALAADLFGNVYVADATDHSIRKIAADGTVTTRAGLGGAFGSTDGTGTSARFKGPLGIATDNAGNVYVADTGNLTIRKISTAGVVTTIAGSAGLAGATDGTGTAARFTSPYGISVDNSGNAFVLESTGVVRKITAAGVVSTVAGATGTNGLVDATGTAARFAVPFDIAVDGSGNLYVSDHGNHAVRRVTSSGVVTTLAGTGSSGNTNATGTAASFRFPSGIAADAAGNVYLADTDNQIIRKITSGGVTTTIGGSGVIGSANGSGLSATFYNPKDVAIDITGKLYIADRANHTIRKGTPATGLAPDMPTAQTYTAGNGSVTIAFAAPSNTGDSGITGYTASCSPSAGGTTISVTGTASPLAVTGLTNAVAYVCWVTASNAAGTSLGSTPQAVTPVPNGIAATIFLLLE